MREKPKGKISSRKKNKRSNSNSTDELIQKLIKRPKIVEEMIKSTS
jgi:hypothetical protein